MRNSVQIDQYIAGHSLVHNLDPRSKIITMALLIMAGCWASFPYGVLLVIAVAVVIIILTRLRWWFLWAGIRLFIPLLIIAMLLQFIVSIWAAGSSDAAWRVNLIFTGAWAVRIMTVIIISRLLTATTSPLALASGLEKLLNPLARVGFPVHELTMIITISLRFIPLFFDEWDKICKAQLARGVDPARGWMKNGFRGLSALIVPLIRISFRRSEELALAMEARGYTGGSQRTRLQRMQMKKADYIFIFIILVFIISLFYH